MRAVGKRAPIPYFGVLVLASLLRIFLWNCGTDGARKVFGGLEAADRWELRFNGWFGAAALGAWGEVRAADIICPGKICIRLLYCARWGRTGGACLGGGVVVAMAW